MNLKSICQVAYDTIYPNAGATTSVKVEHFIEVGLVRYAFEMWLVSKELKRSEGEWDIPETLFREAELTVDDNNHADISSLKIFSSPEGRYWIGRLGDFDCDCGYIRHTVNMANMLCDDEYDGNKKTYIVFGKKIRFPKGVHTKTIPIIYASNGNDVDDEIEIDDAIAGRVEEYLWKRFTGKLPEDRTLNSNSNV